MPAGKLRDILSFQVRAMVDDGYGNEEAGDWVEQFQSRAEMTALRGTEAVMAARLGGKQPYLCSVRCHVNSSRVTTDWRAVNVRSGATYNITTAVTRPKRDMIDMTLVEGVAE